MYDYSNSPEGILLNKDYRASLMEKFAYGNADPDHGHRLFFENSGGSLRLEKAVSIKADLELYPDCPERERGRGFQLSHYVAEGTRQIMEVVFGAKPGKGALITEMTASQTMFRAVGMILENVKWGSNAVTTALEHPSAHDAVEYYCLRTGREFREIPANAAGGIGVEDVLKYVDENTTLVSIMAASNISGNIMDIKEICRRVREINPEIYVVTDCVQHAPHCAIDVEDWNVDVANFAPYKFFACRGNGYAYVSDRVAVLPHPKLLGKAPEVQYLGTPTPGNFASVMAVIDYVCEIGAHFAPDLVPDSAAEKEQLFHQADLAMKKDFIPITDLSVRRALFTVGMHRIHMQERALLHLMLEGTKDEKGLRYIKGVHVYTDCEDLTSKDLIVAMSMDGIGLKELAAAYIDRGVTVCDRHRDSMYSRRIVETLGIVGEGAIRVSPLHCHGEEDISEYLRITREMAEEFVK